jgi:hypothetical protein
MGSGSPVHQLAKVSLGVSVTLGLEQDELEADSSQSSIFVSSTQSSRDELRSKGHGPAKCRTSRELMM